MKVKMCFTDCVFGCLAKTWEIDILFYLRDHTCQYLQCIQREIDRGYDIPSTTIKSTEATIVARMYGY